MGAAAVTLALGWLAPALLSQELHIIISPLNKLSSEGEIALGRRFAAQLEKGAPLVADSWNLWGWVLALCLVVAAVILLILARRQARRRKPDLPTAAPAPQPAENPAVVFRSGLTVTEEDLPHEPPPFRGHASTAVEAEPQAQQAARAKTQTVALFHPTEEGRRAILEATAGPLAGKRYPVTSQMRIGAAGGNDLKVPNDPTLSGFHAVVRLIDSALTVEDTHSSNGTFVNGVRIWEGRRLLKPGDEIRMGRSTFKVRNG
jgi:hypothetical protein